MLVAFCRNCTVRSYLPVSHAVGTLPYSIFNRAQTPLDNCSASEHCTRKVNRVCNHRHITSYKTGICKRVTG
jgi:hypothetical protein